MNALFIKKVFELNCEVLHIAEGVIFNYTAPGPVTAFVLGTLTVRQSF